MKKKLCFVLSLFISSALFVGCSSSTNQTKETTVEQSDCYITLEDRENSIEYPVTAYGETIKLPESNNKDGFVGWLGIDKLYQPGDSIVTEEFMSFTAVYSDPNVGTILAINLARGGNYMMSSEEEMVIPNPYENVEEENHDDFFDFWEDEKGNTYEIDQSVKVEKGDVLILKAVYSTDYQKAFKVNVNYNTGIDDYDVQYYRYVKQGASIPLYVTMVPGGYQFDGWYDAPKEGNKIGNEGEYFMPTSDMSLYGHWTKE